MSIYIIETIPGRSTQERIFALLLEHPEGLSLLTMSQKLNRPVSMLNHCLKPLIATKDVYRKYNPQSKKYLYYANSIAWNILKERMAKFKHLIQIF